MSTPRAIRRLAFQTLYQIDARDGEDGDAIRAALEHAEEFTPREREKALASASGAYEHRREADAEMLRLAPGWPAHRQAAVDRAILRLAHYEMNHAGINPKIAVNEAVELAKDFSTEKSPAFVNGLLDKVLKRVLSERREAAAIAPANPENPAEPDA